MLEGFELEIENFSGLSAHAVKQDFYAKLFVLNLTAVFGSLKPSPISLPRPSAHLPGEFAQALSKMKDNLVRLFVSNSSRQLLTALMLAMATSLEAVRSDRSYPRKIKPAKLHAFHPSLPPQLQALP